jgi:hypothetical protein
MENPMSDFPRAVDRLPLQLRDKRAGPPLDPPEVIACSLNGVPFKWWRSHPSEPPLSEDSEPVRAVMDGLRLAGYSIVPTEAKRDD